MLKPMEGAPTSAAPRLAASMMPGPPPVAITLSRSSSPAVRCAPPRSDAIAPKSRASSYQRRWPPGPSSRIRARAEHHDGRAHAPGPETFLGLGVFQQEADAAHGVAEQELLVQGRQAIGRRRHLRGVGLLCSLMASSNSSVQAANCCRHLSRSSSATLEPQSTRPMTASAGSVSAIVLGRGEHAGGCRLAQDFLGLQQPGEVLHDRLVIDDEIRFDEGFVAAEGAVRDEARRVRGEWTCRGS